MEQYNEFSLKVLVELNEDLGITFDIENGKITAIQHNGKAGW